MCLNIKVENIERFNEATSFTPLDLQIEIARYLPIRNLTKGARILDLGCGAGFSSKLLVEWGASRVVGVDASEFAISEAQRKFNQSNLEFVHGYAEQIAEVVDLTEFDGVCFVECIEHVIDPEIVLASLKNGLAEGVWIYITAPNDYWSYRYENTDNEHHLRKYTKKIFLDSTGAILGNANESGEFHSFIGFSSKKDKLVSHDRATYDMEAVCVSKDIGLNSDDSIFFYALWGNSITNEVIIGSQDSMDTYTKLLDWSKLELNTPDLNDFHIRELSYKLQSTTEALVEAQNELRAISILVNSLAIQEQRDLNSKLISLFQNKKLKPSMIRNVVSSPPSMILAIYKALPSNQKEILRNLRRRILK
jgi:SAM-dependent methyltransferase